MREKIILVIDDDEMNLQIAKMILEKKLPCKVIGVDNGLDGIEVLRRQYVSLVLLDIMMPLFDGIETLQEIRDDPQIKDASIMMLTASGEAEDIKRVRALGVNDYIKKPFMPADLIERVRKKIAQEHYAEILLIGGDKSKLDSLKNIVEEKFPHEVLIATSTDEAQKIFDRLKINLIIAFSDMKFNDGAEFLEFIAGNAELNKIPLAVTKSDKLLELIAKLNPKIKEQLAEEEMLANPYAKGNLPVIEKVAESIVIYSDKKNIANTIIKLIS